MSTQIKNGGIELGILQAASKYAELSEEQIKRMEYLDSLPKGVWITLDENRMAITNEEARTREIEHLKKFKVIEKL